LDPLIVKDKKILKMILTTLNVHPCYLFNLHASNLIENVEFIKTVKQIYSFPSDRANYLIMSFIEHFAPKELRNAERLEDVNFLSKESITGKLFL
jgi:hypothetical protein